MGKRRRAEDPHLAVDADKGIVKEHAHWCGPERKLHRDVSHASPLVGPDDVISASTAGDCNGALGQELPGEEEKLHWNLVRAADERELAAWKNFKVVKIARCVSGHLARGFSGHPSGAHLRNG